MAVGMFFLAPTVQPNLLLFKGFPDWGTISEQLLMRSKLSVIGCNFDATFSLGPSNLDIGDVSSSWLNSCSLLVFV